MSSIKYNFEACLPFDKNSSQTGFIKQVYTFILRWYWTLRKSFRLILALTQFARKTVCWTMHTLHIVIHIKMIINNGGKVFRC